jgi:hypothetical protein
MNVKVDESGHDQSIHARARRSPRSDIDLAEDSFIPSDQYILMNAALDEGTSSHLAGPLHLASPPGDIHQIRG